jgi:hypothetical protein
MPSILVYHLGLSVILTSYPHYTALLDSDNDVLALDISPDDEEMMLRE